VAVQLNVMANVPLPVSPRSDEPLMNNIDIDDDELEKIRYIAEVYICVNCSLKLDAFLDNMKTLRLLTGYKTPYSKEIDEYDMQTLSTRQTVDPVEKLLFRGYGPNSGKLWMQGRRGSW
jgi:hypothetical protein